VADRWVFGRKVNRYELLMTFGAGLEQTLNLTELLPQLADTAHRGVAAEWGRTSVRFKVCSSPAPRRWSVSRAAPPR